MFSEATSYNQLITFSDTSRVTNMDVRIAPMIAPHASAHTRIAAALGPPC